MFCKMCKPGAGQSYTHSQADMQICQACCYFGVPEDASIDDKQL